MEQVKGWSWAVRGGKEGPGVKSGWCRWWCGGVWACVKNVPSIPKF